MVQFSILDYAQIDEGETSYDAIQNTVALARHAEQLGFKRFWVAEHHDVPAFASSSPELLMMHIADHTEHIKIGSGGVMIPHYSSYKVAENIRLLQATHRGRIDLGVGNTVGTKWVNEALNEGKDKRSYQSAIEDLKAYLYPQMPEDFRFKELTARPVVEESPEIWMLSTSVRNAEYAAQSGVKYCYGLFPGIPGDRFEVGKEALQAYNDQFVPNSSKLPKGTMVAVFAAIGETEKEAEELGKAIHLWLLGQDDFSHFKRIPSVATARDYPLTTEQKERIKAQEHRVFVASRQQLKEKLDQWIDYFKTDEVLLCLLAPGIKQRMNSLNIIAQEYQL
ncbi:MsnO8 family LLM class oxidoreductase [Dolosicoccus paucivorans]|uniref:MsnO8 family LLM class oxidoreductase n=1 Tax=Dolosicoccus paucivorans TaxID=84521 RepID=A0A1G8L2N4_9LACT|nr:MsnO8 family LLM class oxidoreductase [Dolosicoccus paucivorans]PMB83731.1 MsnO8 family LLM class oxidoreductase [Dolosicoccus paucivorans]PMC58645.1 MsnO8 family LLM class oxidoreductase [Dolosicoccus paucivorans]SDI49952.1 luciferase family oxidoreductase, group 1 [Dolosicoccus paucivorans]